ncbi:PREDICTED: ER membrane protein complex subunit 7 homolog isoform X2 [Ipomoea nil]|uniref:ER membrane protein complex subunit 7 homolog isoform X2 n=1 Tax=Ipomoea nil TaxID=35883 RepID=UPI000900EB47|nr:PREDICTED: ER membrane protein complex subunit 7 homolog isoform X2 [Ipomoea nil]
MTWPIFFPLLFLLQLCFWSLAVASGDGYTINGRVKLPGFNLKGSGLLAKASDVKVLLNGGQRVTFLRPDGYFSFHNVPAGTHLIEVDAIGYFFSPVRVDVSARNPGKVQAALTENRRSLTELVLEPLREEQYYEIREPFSVMSIVKSPMGLMVGFMLLVVFVMPKLVENMDPEEIRRAQEEMRSQGVPTLSSLLPGAGAAAQRSTRQSE